MDEDTNSWIRRTKFSHTICHRLDSGKLGIISFGVHEGSSHRLDSRPLSSSLLRTRSLVSSSLETLQKPVMNKQRSLSPLIEKTVMPETFKEARSDLKRFSTPLPQRSKPERKSSVKFFSFMEPKESKSNLKPKKQKSRSSTSPLRHLGSMKISDGPKSKTELAWAKYFEHGGVKVTAVETADEWMVDLSQLFLGLRFAHGAHSRLYHGIYKEQPVAVKIITVPDDDENGAMAARLENQFSREVNLLSRIHHKNVIKVIPS